MNIKDDFTIEEIDDYISVINEYHKKVRINELKKEIKEEKDPMKQAMILSKIMEIRGVKK